MELQQFALRYKLKIRLDECREEIVIGRKGHIYFHDSEYLGMMFMPDNSKSWGYARKKCELLGMIIWQDGDCEGCVLFNPEDSKQSRLVISLVKAKKKGVASPAKLESLQKAREVLRLARQDCV